MEKNENETKEEKNLLLSDKHTLLPNTRQFLYQLWRKDTFHCIPARFIIVIMCFLGISTVFALRVNISIAILAMVKESSENDGKVSITTSSINYIQRIFFRYISGLPLSKVCRLTYHHCQNNTTIK